MAEPSPDITRARVAALEAELAAVRAEMQNFTYAVSHDLRAPLRHIVSYAKLVQEDAGPQLTAEVQEFLTTITESGHLLGVMLDGLLALSRVGTAPVEIVAVSLQELVMAVTRDLTSDHPQRCIEWRIASDLPQVLADANLLRKALVEVLSNAVKFTGMREQAVIEITHFSDPDGSCETLQVQDNGVGYNPALQDQLFRVFGRLNSGQQFAGIGVGLVLVRKMLDRFDGSISAQGTMGDGCRVCLRLKHA